ncbi:Sua5/YciO/YrdC/YwlC family protein [Leuconostocaceae bacterium ESL0723]|nr:Sua5/YciO/YrdC/YwlC family protein [Leuconostocaceae bacterium ESL0723]
MTETATKKVEWNGGVQPEAIDILKGDGGMIVSPTKVGYIIMTSDKAGLERKFAAKHRKRNKPGVVLCGSMEELKELAEMTPEIEKMYQIHWDQDILLGCILPWKESGKAKIPADGSQELMMDGRETSCFVIKFGKPSENIAREMWEKYHKFSFASSANPSGKGNRGLVSGIGDEIESAADLIIGADDYVASIQPDKNIDTRYEQGVMVSMVDEKGQLIPEQNGKVGVTPAPVVIRKGLDVDKIMKIMSDIFNTWDYRHGFYY